MRFLAIIFMVTACNLEGKNKSICEESCGNCTTAGYLDCKEVCDDITQAAYASSCFEEVDDYFYCLKAYEYSCLTAEDCSSSRDKYLACVLEYCIETKDDYICNN